MFILQELSCKLRCRKARAELQMAQLVAASRGVEVDELGDQRLMLLIIVDGFAQHGVQRFDVCVHNLSLFNVQQARSKVAQSAADLRSAFIRARVVAMRDIAAKIALCSLHHDDVFA